VAARTSGAFIGAAGGQTGGMEGVNFCRAGGGKTSVTPLPEGASPLPGLSTRKAGLLLP
jgi:hypothetical protein